MSNQNAKIDDVIALRDSVEGKFATVADALTALATAQAAALSKPTRAARVKAEPVELSREDTIANACGFNKRSLRRDMFLAMLAKGPGSFELSEFPGALADAQAIQRRISGIRTKGRITADLRPTCGFELSLDKHEGVQFVHIVAHKAEEAI